MELHHYRKNSEKNHSEQSVKAFLYSDESEQTEQALLARFLPNKLISTVTEFSE